MAWVLVAKDGPKGSTQRVAILPDNKNFQELVEMAQALEKWKTAGYASVEMFRDSMVLESIISRRA